jgi:hypothetical protein
MISHLFLPQGGLLLEFIDEPTASVEGRSAVRSTHVNRDDWLFGLHASNAVCDGHSPEAVGGSSLVCEPVQHLRQFFFPSIEFQPEHVGIAFCASGETDETDDGPHAINRHPFQQGIWVKPPIRGVHNHLEG